MSAFSTLYFRRLLKRLIKCRETIIAACRFPPENLVTTQVDRGTGIFHGPGSPRMLSEVAEHGVNTLSLVGAPAGGGDPECPFRRFPGRLARHQAADAPVQPSGRQIDPVVRTGHLVTELIGHVVLQQEFRLHTDYVGQRRERVVKPDFPEHHGQDVQQILVDPGGEGLRKLLSIPASRPALGLDVELELRLGAARPDGYPAVVEPERDEVTGFPVSLALVWPVTSVAAVVDPRHAHPGQLLRTAAAQSLHHIAYRLESAAAGDDQRPAEVAEAADLRVDPVKVVDQRLPGPRQVFVQPCQVQGGRHRVLVPEPGRVEVTVGLFRREREKLRIGQRPAPAFGLAVVGVDRMSYVLETYEQVTHHVLAAGPVRDRPHRERGDGGLIDRAAQLRPGWVEQQVVGHDGAYLIPGKMMPAPPVLYLGAQTVRVGVRSKDQAGAEGLRGLLGVPGRLWHLRIRDPHRNRAEGAVRAVRPSPLRAFPVRHVNGVPEFLETYLDGTLAATAQRREKDLAAVP